MVIQSYSDGSEFTGKHLAATLVGGAILGTIGIAAREVLVNRSYKKIRRNYAKAEVNK